MRPLTTQNALEGRIFTFRGLKVMLDRDIAQLYGTATKALNQAVQRNRERFPKGFMFRLTASETRELVTICDRFGSLKHSSKSPLAFTEFGVAMLSSVLRSRRAIRINLQIIKVFIRLRGLALPRHDIGQRLSKLESLVKTHDKEISDVLDAMRRIKESESEDLPPRKIGFILKDRRAPSYKGNGFSR